MGDISELRGLVTVITFLGVFALLIGWIPSTFFTAGEEREVYVPDFFDIVDVYSFAETSTWQLNETGGDYSWAEWAVYYVSVDIGSWDIDFYYRRPGFGDYYCELQHVWYEWWVIPSHHLLEWFNRAGVSRGTDLRLSEIETDAAGASTVTYRAVCGHTTYHTTFAYDEDVYSSYEDAWDNGDLFVFFGVNFDDVNTSYNAWQVISMLLFFQLPDINPIINAIIAVPLWVCIAYLSFILILRAIGAIFGGGA